MAVRIESSAEPVPGYKLIERLGGGGFGEVWKCEAPGGLHKAIKFVFGDLKSAGDNGHRAEQELKALSRVKTVRHPFILSLERYDIIDGQLIIIMELADRNLWDRFKECRARGLPGIPREELLGYMDECAEALDLMNEQYQLQHLDIKPQNLFLVYQHVKVADFGLVKDLEGMQASVTGGVTPVYAAPETFDGWVSRFCDEYSLAIVYQELLTGQRPFNGTNVRQLILQHLQSPPNLSPLPPADQPIIGRALSKKPDERFPTCREMARLLRQASLDPGAAAPPISPSAALPSPPVSTPDSLRQLADSPAMPTTSYRIKPGGSHGGATRFMRSPEPATLQATVPSERKAPTEVNGEGALLPALIVGLGQLGMTVLQKVREHLAGQFGSMSALPQLRTLLLDTDPEVIRTATRGPGGGLSAGDVVLAPLNRPSYYLRPREGRPGLDAWFNPRMLYRIPRSQVTTGVRALGRLAFCDNYRAIVRRLQSELEGALDPEALNRAAKSTKLGIRTNRPRIYVVTSLAGGTGSGSFLDVAYTIRALLRQMGYEQPDVVGLLLVPPVDGSRTRTLAIGNAYAALTELVHYASPGTTFTAQYHDREAPVRDSDPPFGRVLVLPLPDETDEVATRELVELAGQFLARDVASPLGRACDLARAGVSGPPWDSRGLYYGTFGLFQLSCPRPTLERTVARRLCQRMVHRWMTKDSKPIRATVQSWVQEQWSTHGLGADSFIEKLREAARTQLGRPPEDAFTAVIEPLVRRTVSAVHAARAARKPTPIPEITGNEVTLTLRRFEEMLGRPDDDIASEGPGTLVALLRQSADKLTGEWGQKLAEMSVRLIEEPDYRLAGAEESIRQAVASIEQVLQHHEPLAKDLDTKAREAYGRLKALTEPPAKGARRYVLEPVDVIELLRCYPKWRFQSVMLHQVTAAYVCLRGHLSDELREVNYCRIRLGELLRMLEEPAGEADAANGADAGRRLFPAGCRDKSEAVEQFLAGIAPEAVHELEASVQAAIRSRFHSLVNICLTDASMLKNVEVALMETAREFVAGHLPRADVAELFLEQNPEPEQAAGEVEGFFTEAAPEMTPAKLSRVSEVCVVAAPPGPAGDQLRDVFRQALPETELHAAAGTDDVVIFRELVNLPLTELEQLGSQGQDAYRQMSSADNFTPHSRIDVDFGSHQGL
jgi:eukaryotic-like serine/threonine-protein kinase